MSEDVMKTWDSMLVPFHDILARTKVRNYLEWGGGEYSTKWAKNCPSIFNHITIEHDSDWFNKIDTPNKHLCDLVRHKECEYTQKPLDLDMKFDMIVVDGRNRNICLKNALRLTSSYKSIVLLHDADRAEYWPGIQCWPHARIYRRERTVLLRKCPFTEWT